THFFEISQFLLLRILSLSYQKNVTLGILVDITYLWRNNNFIKIEKHQKKCKKWVNLHFFDKL
ncbi:MAG: hypothetical protein SPI06_04990, partial [Terrisporobacter sp.]|uniref:hypothetical protein n=1 Tax=Terrisporobacter sp. TaxID=1965305 RepID=UPI002A90BDDA